MFISHARRNSKEKLLHVIILMVFKPFPFLIKQPIWHVTVGDFQDKLKRKFNLSFCFSVWLKKNVNLQISSLYFFFPFLIKTCQALWSCLHGILSLPLSHFMVFRTGSVMESSQRHSTQRSLAAIRARGTRLPARCAGFPSPDPFWGRGFSLSACRSRMEPWGPGQGCCWPSWYVERLELRSGLLMLHLARLSSTAFAFSHGYYETNQIHEAKRIPCGVMI